MRDKKVRWADHSGQRRRTSPFEQEKLNDMTTTTAQKQVTASTAAEAEHLLNMVTDELQRHAREEGSHGILVTKTGPGQFTVELSDHVPYGITEEVVANVEGSFPPGLVLIA
jgi:hypothetical protein